MLCALLLLGQVSTSQQILVKAKDRIDRATTLSVTVESFAEEFPRPEKTKWWYRKGGYYRYENAQGWLIASPTRTWSCKPSEKGYKILPGSQTDWSLSRQTGLGDLLDPALMPPIGGPKRVKWHGRSTLRIEVDGRKAMTKETKLYFYFDPKTHDHLGTSANLGSITQVRIYWNVEINPTIPASKFRFVPPKGWSSGRTDPLIGPMPPRFTRRSSVDAAL